MTAAVFVDTSIFVYARDASEPTKQPVAAKWIEQLWIEQRGRTSVQVLNEYYLTVTRKLDPGMPPDEAMDDVRSLLAWQPQAVDADVLLQTHEIERRFGLRWWDAMIVAAAQLQNCTLLLTENLEDGLVCNGVTVRNPFTLQIADEHADYVATPDPASRHRARGRPRRTG